MILNQKQTTLAYRCPHCGASVTSMVGVFSLSADMIRMKCPCGESDLSVVYTKDKKVRLSVPCFLCPKPHTFTLSMCQPPYSSGCISNRDLSLESD